MRKGDTLVLGCSRTLSSRYMLTRVVYHTSRIAEASVHKAKRWCSRVVANVAGKRKGVTLLPLYA